MRFRQIILAYFVIGTVMFGGGAVDWDNAGVAEWFVTTDGDEVAVQGQAQDNLQDAGDIITNLIGSFGGPLLVVWNLVVGITAFLHWPVVVLDSNNAPPILTLLIGGGFVVGFYMSLVGLVISGS